MIVKPLQLLLFLLLTTTIAAAQDVNRGAFIGFFGGLSGYQGDLQPNSFSFDQAKRLFSISVRQPLTGRLSLKGGYSSGKIGAADAFNRHYLRVRNLSFQTGLKEAFLLLDWTLLNSNTARLTPFVNGGLVGFQFNPYTTGPAGDKVFLQPLGTEGQGLADYPDRKLYKLTQLALAFGGGLRLALHENVTLNLEASQRKTFTDYLDDVSKSYADQNKLMAARGARSVELAFRGDELSGSSAYPAEGEQRGTPTEMDWYYFAGLSLEIRITAIKNVFKGSGEQSFGGMHPLRRHTRKDWYNKRCPKVF